MKVILRHLPKGSKHNHPKKIVIHAMSEWLVYNKKKLSATSFLEKVGLSAHALVSPAGPVIRCRKDNEGAYHAKGYNTDSLGVEFLVNGTHSYATFLEAIKTDYITDVQWESGLELVRGWMEKFDIGKEQIVTHSELSPGRKFDPGEGFNFKKFIDEL